jgi:hypothetical protein
MFWKRHNSQFHLQIAKILHYTVFLLIFLFCQLYFAISQNYFLSLLNVKVTKQENQKKNTVLPFRYFRTVSLSKFKITTLIQHYYWLNSVQWIFKLQFL